MSRVKNIAKISNLWKKRYKGVWNEGMMGDDCWMLYCDDANHPYKRKSYVKHFKVFLI